jgi:hypothetical protein
MKQLPKYSDLPQLADTQERHAWQVFGEGDQLGTINLLGAEQVKQASQLDGVDALSI